MGHNISGTVYKCIQQ